jgi:lipid-A-disaccharide synthase
MKYYIIAGEASGDLHGSNLMKEIKLTDSNAEFRFWGGDLMKAQGGYLVRHYRDMSFMGFVEVVANLRFILKSLEYCKKDIIAFRPHALILIDYPGFNLRVAEYAKLSGLRVYYYISPQVWAWKQSRVNNIKRDVDHMFVILPFEKAFYQKHSYPVDFVGHPLLDALPDINTYTLHDKKIIALLPGSRKQEIKTMLPVMIDAAATFTEFEIVIACAPSIDRSLYEEFTSGKNVRLAFGKTYEILQQADAALVTSGTATLETALLNVPQVVCYKGNRFSYLIARQIVKIKYISLVNLIMDTPHVKELIQAEFTVENVRHELKNILKPDVAENMREGYKRLKQLLGNKGASERTATLINKYLTKKHVNPNWDIY